MLYTTDSLKNALRAHRPYRSLMEESGIEITEVGMTSNPTKSPESLKLLAYSRAHSRYFAFPLGINLALNEQFACVGTCLITREM